MLNQIARFVSGDAAKARELASRADRLRDMKSWKEAASLYKEALDTDGSLAHVWVQYGHALKESGSLQEAEKAYKMALSLDDTADTHLQLGHLHKIMKRMREAEQDYLHAYERGPELKDVRHELNQLGWTSARLRSRTSSGETGVRLERDSSTTHVVIELSDLIDFLQGARYPTGIQRVQLALAEAFVEAFDDDAVSFVYFDHPQSLWRQLDRRYIADLIDLVQNAGRTEEARLDIASRIKTEVLQSEQFDFPPGGALVNPGTSWGYLNYFLALRKAKRQHEIRYIPLVHDTIPLLFPEYCNSHLVQDFINWISGICTHADLILTNSENTKSDFYRAATELELPHKPASTIHLNGEFGKPTPEAGSLNVLRANNLDSDEYVLIVSTIEPRKNHAIALAAWSRMLRTKEGRKLPKLVCVGSSGWMNDDFHQQIARNATLRDHVVILNNVSDHVLDLLYERCLFTVFPSMYEGWGLPISEALAHGKVPLVSNVSSHPEAGGENAIYFELGSEADFQAKLMKLIFDAEYRVSLERKIAKAKPLRPWGEIAQQIFQVIGTLPKPSSGSSQRADQAPEWAQMTCGVYHSFARNLALRLRDILYNGEIFRAGDNWHSPEAHGCWVAGRTADIAFSLTEAPGDSFIVYLHWQGSPNIENETVISVPTSGWSKRVRTTSGQQRWDRIPVSLERGSKRLVKIRLNSGELDDFGKASDGRDLRTASVGVVGIFVAAAGDVDQRLSLTEALTFDGIQELARRFPQVAHA